MSKIKKIFDEGFFTRKELKEIIEEAARRIEDLIVVHISDRYKRCGKPGCQCMTHYDRGHGPYVYATWVEHGSARSKSLGRKITAKEFDDLLVDPVPKPYNYRVPRAQLEKAGGDWDRHDRGWDQYTLSSWEYEEYYGVTPDEDTFGRPETIWYKEREHSRELKRWRDRQRVVNSKYCSLYGISTPKGVKFLEEKEAQGHEID